MLLSGREHKYDDVDCGCFGVEQGGVEMKIVQVSCFSDPEFRAGGIIYCQCLAKALAHNNEVKVFARTKVPDLEEYTENLRKSQHIDITLLPFSKAERFFYKYNVIFNPWAGRAFRKFLQKEQPDIVHFQSIQWLGASVISEASKLQLPVVVTLHDGWWFCPLHFFYQYYRDTPCTRSSYAKCVKCLTMCEDKPAVLPFAGKLPYFLYNAPYMFFRRWYLKHVARKIDLCISPSKFLARKYIDEGFPPGKMVVSPNGLDESLGGNRQNASSAHQAIQNRKIRFGFLSGTGEMKGFDIVIKAIQRLDPSKFTLTFWGTQDDDTAKRITESLSEVELSFNGTYARKELPGIFAEMDVLLFASKVQENCPLTILEALANRVPVTASDVGAVSELVNDNIDGLLFKPDDSVDLAAKMQAMIDKPSLVTELRSNIEPVRSISDQARELQAMYRELISTARHPPRAVPSG